MIFQLTYDYPTFITFGVLVVAVYGIWLRLAARKEEPAAQSSTIEGVLDELLAGKITRDQAAARIRSIAPKL